MDTQNTSRQLRYLEEVRIPLHRAGFETLPVEGEQLPVLWNGAPLCRITGKGSVFYRREDADTPQAEDALYRVEDIAAKTLEYMTAMEAAPQLKASGLDGDYRILADFGGTVLAGSPSKYGVQFVTWDWDYDRTGVVHGHYFMENYDGAKQDFSNFRYSANDVRCKDCTRYDSGHPCHLNECVCLEERIEAGVVELNALARECFGGRMFRPLQRRLRDELNRQPFRFFLSDAHRERWTHWKNRCYGMSERNAAALFLLAADEGLWQRVLWHFDSSGFDFPAIRLSGIHPELYSIYQAAKTISVGGDNIVIEDLAFSELVSDRAFRLILGALLLCRYGEVVLNLERKTEETT